MTTTSKARAAAPMTTQEILKRRKAAEQQSLADRQYYADMVQKVALGQADEADRQAVETLAEEFGYNLAADLDKLRKLIDWAKCGFVEVGSEHYETRLAELQHRQAEAQVDRDELQQRLSKAELELRNAQNAHGKFSSRGGEIQRFRAAMPHVFEAEGLK